MVTAGLSLKGTSTATVEFCPGAVVSASLVVSLADFPRFRLSIVLTFVVVLVADFFAISLFEALFAFVVCSLATDFPLIELLVERGAAASVSEVLLGLDDDAVGSMTFFCLFVAAVPVALAAVSALRLAGAMILIALGSFVSKRCDK